MESVFSSLHESLQEVLAQRLAWNELREVQERAFRAISAGNDVLVLAPTAGGKSEAALIPVMDDILKNGRPGVSCLYISPLKALINDQEERFSTFATPAALTVMKWHGDVPKGDRSWKDEPPGFLMITPESLEVLLEERVLSRELAQVRYIIIDELHAFVESERGVHLMVLLDRMDRLTGRSVQRIGLSATTGNPEEILEWLAGGRHGQELVAVPSAPKEKHFRFIIEPEENRRIDALAWTVQGKKALVFVNSRSSAEHLMQSLEGSVRNLHIHHSSLASATRKASEEAFASQDGACIICTSTLELGIDIGDLDVVVQVGPPSTVSSFLQRMGRSGRRGKAATVTWILKNPCELLCSLAIIECAMEKQVENLIPPARPWNVLLQQLFLLLHRRLRATRREVIDELLSFRAFEELDPADIGRIIRHLVSEGYLTADGEILMPGTEAERVFGRSNWKDLYSVITGGGEYRAITPDGDVVGKLDARFVSSRDGGEVTLGGRNWSMVKSDEGHNIVIVVPGGPAPARTFWTGSGDDGYSGLICRKVREIACRKGTILPLAEPERVLLEGIIADLPARLTRSGLFVTGRRGTRGREVVVYTFSGSRFNRVLAGVLSKKLGSRCLVRYDDFVIRIQRAGKDGAAERVAVALESVRNTDPSRLASSLSLPPPESWKFARILPKPIFAAMASSDHYLLDRFIEEYGAMQVVVAPTEECPHPDPVEPDGAGQTDT